MPHQGKKLAPSAFRVFPSISHLFPASPLICLAAYIIGKRTTIRVAQFDPKGATSACSRLARPHELTRNGLLTQIEAYIEFLNAIIDFCEGNGTKRRLYIGFIGFEVVCYCFRCKKHIGNVRKRTICENGLVNSKYNIIDIWISFIFSIY